MPPVVPHVGGHSWKRNCVKKKLWFSPVIDAVSTRYLALCELAGNTFVSAFKTAGPQQTDAISWPALIADGRDGRASMMGAIQQSLHANTGE